jgi:predicted nucleotide-binding protein
MARMGSGWEATQMARAPAPPPRANLSISAAREAVPRLESRIRELRELDLTNAQSADDANVQALEALIRSTLAGIYGEHTAEYHRLVDAANLDRIAYSMQGWDGTGGTSIQDVLEGLERGRSRAIGLLTGEVTALKERPDFSTIASAVGTTARTSSKPAVLEVFIVHGQDVATKTEVARFLEHAGLTPIILHEQPNNGRTIIEKFEHHGANAGFAVVLLTPDDVGGTDPTKLRPRARQNVIGEMFWFAGKLGRKRVCALMKGDLEIPSDFSGVIYTAMDERGAWKMELLRELEAADYKVDWKALSKT